MAMTNIPQTYKRKHWPKGRKYYRYHNRIKSEKKTTLPSITNQEWRTEKSKTEKVNNLLTNIPTNDIREVNDLIRRSKISLWKNQVPLDDQKKVKIQSEITDKKTMTRSKITKTEHPEIFGRTWKSTVTRTKIKLRTNQKYWRKKEN